MKVSISSWKPASASETCRGHGPRLRQRDRTLADSVRLVSPNDLVVIQEISVFATATRGSGPEGLGGQSCFAAHATASFAGGAYTFSQADILRFIQDTAGLPTVLGVTISTILR